MRSLSEDLAFDYSFLSKLSFTNCKFSSKPFDYAFGSLIWSIRSSRVPLCYSDLSLRVGNFRLGTTFNFLPLPSLRYSWELSSTVLFVLSFYDLRLSEGTLPLLTGSGYFLGGTSLGLATFLMYFSIFSVTSNSSSNYLTKNSTILYCFIFRATSWVRLTAILLMILSRSIMKTVLMGGTRLTCGDSLVAG